MAKKVIEVNGCHDCYFAKKEQDMNATLRVCDHFNAPKGYGSVLGDNGNIPHWCPLLEEGETLLHIKMKLPVVVATEPLEDLNKVFEGEESGRPWMFMHRACPECGKAIIRNNTVGTECSNFHCNYVESGKKLKDMKSYETP